ncbi:MAG TPA: hypothetical protein VFR67_06695 [Pilimelia sp.]|nr:hypothetical protein [Pilimelia sp.]
MWTLFEPIHAVTYFTPEAREAFEEAGLRGFWRGYFAGRAAPLGAIGTAPVVASFFMFAPPMVARAVPDVWSRADPQLVLAARSAGASVALRRLLGGPADGGGSGGSGSDGGGAAGPAAANGAVEEAADLLESATEDLDCAGRVLGAANAALPRPTDPYARLWQFTTLLREHRGDGHVAALVAAGVTGCEAVVWRAALDIPRATMQPSRGWTDGQWQAATGRLAERGWLDAEGAPTAAGRARYAEVEEATDLTAEAPWRRLGPAAVTRLAAVMRPLTLACAAAMPYPNPIGLPPPKKTP